MGLVLEQTFPLGRFHATPWRSNPFDTDGEWPPSPWRLVRSVIARWYQWNRETGDGDDATLADLVKALSSSSFAFYLPPTARPGAVLRQYQPIGFGWQPGSRTKNEQGRTVKIPGMKSHARSLVQDSFWAVPVDEPILWFIDGAEWTPDLVDVLDRCLERVTWFGRADSYSTIRRRRDGQGVEPNCSLSREGSVEAVPVLCPTADALRADLERVTDDPKLIAASVPPGAEWRFALPPKRTPLHAPVIRRGTRDRTPVVQFAVSCAVAPETRVLCRLTKTLRDRAVRCLTADYEGRSVSWSRAERRTRDELTLFVGKNADGQPLRGRRHAQFAVCIEDGAPTRIVVRRATDPHAATEVDGLDEREVAALLRAASQPLTWTTAGSQVPAWSVSLVPLTPETPLPAGFDASTAQTWRSVTPFVPTRHRLRRGIERAGEDVASQVRRELALRGWPVDGLVVEEAGPPRWTAVHVPSGKSRQRAFIGDRMGFDLRLRFRTPVRGPIVLGQSSTFGVGLFAPEGGSVSGA
ncbi:MAG: type I-U CRISPR-associated protein Cas5/Cas6 [Myxococcales bacterium]|nr:type I-U CRISPR-associated protein Cas5/Cas6 [Myxococcales bacterium]